MEKLLIISILSLGIVAVSGRATIDPSLNARFFSGGGSGQSVMVSFTNSLSSVFSQIDRMNFTSMFAKRNALTELQQAFANTAQGALKTFLNARGVNFESFWINNKMVIQNASPFLVNAMSFVPGVSRIEPEPQGEIFLPVDIPQPEELNLTRSARQNRLEWGVRMVRADQVWNNNYKGRNIVVGIIDTGVRYTHEALRGRWRSNYGWLDPYSGTSTPNDGNGHGTHVAGTIVGVGGTGVAPEAQFIACKGCSTSSCGGSQLIRCGQFMQCPTRPDGSAKNCDMAPHIVSNSWGGGRGSSWYDDVIRSWRSSGIIPIISIGNSGPNCDTANTPGDRNNVIGVGSTDSSERISRFSSRGPTTDGRVKPDISAPGSDIRSSWHTSDNAYNTISGTSMACPHVSGVVALMMSKTSGLSYDRVYNGITRTAARSSLNTGSAQACAGVSSSTWPNHAFGYGRIDAVNSVNAV